MTIETHTETAEGRLDRLLERLLTSGEAAAAAHNWDQAREAAEDVLTVDPGNARALALVEQADVAARRSLGERSLMTVLFSDLVDSTPIAEASTPELMREILRLYREHAQAAINRFDGTILQFLGDGIVASFGYPQPHEDDARRAVHAALEMLRSLGKAREEAQKRHGIDIQVRAGIHTGLVVVGDLGEGPARERHAIVGVTPNLAARLQSEAEPGTVVISDVTHHLVATDFDFLPQGVRQLKGISRPVEIFTVLGPRPVRSRLTTEQYRGPMVGRDAELATLLASWEQSAAASGHEDGQPVEPFCIIGDPGMGKSRLVAELLSAVSAGGGEAVEIECLPYYADIPFHPLERGLESLLGIDSNAGGESRSARLVEAITDAGMDPATAVPLIAPVLGIDSVPGYTPPELDPTALRQATISAVVGYVRLQASVKPLLLVAEDVDAADPSTLELLGQLASSPPPGLLTVMTARSSLVAAWFETIEPMTLGGLSTEDAETLIDLLAGPATLPQETTRSIIERAEGIPLFIEELVYSTLQSPDKTVVPMRLQELLTARLHAQGVDLRTAQIAATAGDVFDAEVLENVSGNGDEAQQRADGASTGGPATGNGGVPPKLAGLIQAGIVVADEGEGRYRFYHPLLREAAYETQLLDIRRDTHSQLASALTAVDAEPGVIARHFDLGGASAEAVPQYIAAAQVAQSKGAHVEAANLTTRALELVLEWPADPQRHHAELTVRLVRALSYSSVQGYAAPDVVEDFSEAEKLTELIGPAPEIMPAMIAIWSYRLVHGETRAAAALIDRLLEMSETEIGSWFAAEVEGSAGFQALFHGELEEAAFHLERAFAAFDARPDESLVSEFWPLPNDPLAVSQVAYACVLALEGDLRGAAEWERRAVERANQVPFPRGPFSLAFVNIYLAWLRYVLGDRQEAQQAGLEVVQIGQQHGYAYWLALGAVFYRIADPDLDEFNQTLATLGAIGHQAFLPAYLGIKSAVEAHNDPATAEATMEDALTLAREVGEELHIPLLLLQRADQRLSAGGQDAAAAADLSAAVEAAESQGSRLLALRAALRMARLPEPARPREWKPTLARQVDAFDGVDGLPELEEAASFLG